MLEKKDNGKAKNDTREVWKEKEEVRQARILRGVSEATKLENIVVNNPNPLYCPLVADLGIIRSKPSEVRPITARFGGTPAYPWLATVQNIIADSTTSSKVPCANHPVAD